MAGGYCVLDTSMPCCVLIMLCLLCTLCLQLYEGYHAAYTAQVEGAGEGALQPGVLVPAKASFKLAAEVALLVSCY